MLYLMVLFLSDDDDDHLYVHSINKLSSNVHSIFSCIILEYAFFLSYFSSQLIKSNFTNKSRIMNERKK